MALYAIVLLLMGMSTSWAAPACNNPIFAEIVPSHMRNLIYAFDRSFEMAIAACGAPLVGILAERLFHFTVCACLPLCHLPPKTCTCRLLQSSWAYPLVYYAVAGGAPVPGSITSLLILSLHLGQAFELCM